ncbi:DUF6774 domain-containing protein [Lacrimispora defluvii]|uniref:DUF6774 domain-containing protein n=1 Tax=Lacrimispora defluvii TaxID=2719233 RepID=UPI0034DCF6F9
MSYCCDVLFISTLACQIADCLNDDELSLLAADTVLLSDALNAIAVRRSITNSCSTNSTPATDKPTCCEE